ncbi:MAG: putative phospholipid ABC transporter permease protein MlaE [Candidatus Omnitrophica bacterium]|nr:putative phospholipid ABC transporter permease protein MlaE [Candidatus Omnitrophota bacterium]
MITALDSIGRLTHGFLRQAGDMLAMFCQCLFWIVVGPFKRKPVPVKNFFAQTVFSGWDSLLIVIFVDFFIGMVLAMQSAYQLEQLGATIYVAALVGVSMTREIGPVLTALVIAGRVGAAITAELATMKVTEQVEALQTIGLNPVRYLVAPRLLALALMLPVLTVIGDLMGMVGGYVIGVTNLGLGSGLYIDTTIEFLTNKDILTGLLKSFVFALIIAMISCQQGLGTEGGAEGVGRSTTRSVVTSFIMIIVADAILTALFYFAG